MNSPPVYDAAFIDNLSPFWKSLPLPLGTTFFYQCMYVCIWFNTVIYVFLFLCLCILNVCLCIFIVPTGSLRLP